MYIIDGHNLIGKIPGWSLRNIDDEQQLIEVLRKYCTAQRRSVDVFFDRAPLGYAGTRSYGSVKAHFVREGTTADDAIRFHLAGLGKGARNVIVVSSDNQVRAEAHSHQAAVLSSEEFARELSAYLPAAEPVKKNRKARPAAEASADEIEDWLAMFGGEPDEGVPPPKRSTKPGKKKKR